MIERNKRELKKINNLTAHMSHNQTTKCKKKIHFQSHKYNTKCQIEQIEQNHDTHPRNAHSNFRDFQNGYLEFSQFRIPRGEHRNLHVEKKSQIQTRYSDGVSTGRLSDFRELKTD